ncbi:putative FMN-dependent luciferase-like monooxygenase [Microbacterium sp. No. 7]|uniref:putative FMN-dependent luciferase-like monooxygenase n=1 Tax=Microbacterium sp. No. 7 TaxID=1714373 RepID=UPI001E337C8B|nr:putative FMN-dependent luciferase-like monooxygenase [Microbacterium sp. No. 7]
MTVSAVSFFSRLLGGTPAPQRYDDALAEIGVAERLGFHRAWVAQHHLSGDEGGLPSPLVFLAHAAARTSRIRLATGVITVGLEEPIRAAEDAAVLDVLSGGRLDIGLGSGGSAALLTALGLEGADRTRLYEDKVAAFRAALDGAELGGGRLWPPAPGLSGRIWQATFSVQGGRRAGLAGDGLLLSRTQPRPEGRPSLPLADVQLPIIEAYLDALPAGVAPRIMASRTVYVADDRERALAQAATGIARVKGSFERLGQVFDGDDAASLIRTTDAHVGTPDDVAASLAKDASIAASTELAIQVHSIDPPSDDVRASLELFAARVAPALGLPLA